MTSALFGDATSHLILTLYRGAGCQPPEDFKRWALAELAGVLRFDGAFWLTTAGDGIVHDAFVQGWPGREAEWRAGRPAGETEAPALLRHFGIRGVLRETREEAHTTLRETLSLYRTESDRRFCDGERQLLRLLLPHLVESYRRNLLASLQTPRCASANGGGFAICDGDGLLHRASDAFTELLLTEAPQWQGPRLPWAKTFATAGRRVLIKGERLIIAARRGEDLFHLHARPRTPLDGLSPAELRVARELAGGASYKSAAQRLGLSPSTINNHAVSLYRKLGVDGKAALARRWHEFT